MLCFVCVAMEFLSFKVSLDRCVRALVRFDWNDPREMPNLEKCQRTSMEKCLCFGVLFILLRCFCSQKQHSLRFWMDLMQLEHSWFMWPKLFFYCRFSFSLLKNKKRLACTTFREKSMNKMDSDLSHILYDRRKSVALSGSLADVMQHFCFWEKFCCISAPPCVAQHSWVRSVQDDTMSLSGRRLASDTLFSPYKEHARILKAHARSLSQSPCAETL